MSLINEELKKSNNASLDVKASKQNLKKPQSKIQSLKKSKSQSGICKSCQKRDELICKLKELFKKLESINTPKDDNGLLVNMYTKDLNWLEENIPLITYPLKSKPSCIWDNPCQDYPPWKLPRFPSQELIASRMHKNCECRKRNGLQDGCSRSLCKGSVYCLRKPDPVCIPSGMWKKMFTPEEYEKLMDYIDGKSKEKQVSIEYCTCEPDPPKKKKRPSKKTSSSCTSCCSRYDSCSGCGDSTAAHWGSRRRSDSESFSSHKSARDSNGSKLASAVIDKCIVKRKKGESQGATDSESENVANISTASQKDNGSRVRIAPGDPEIIVDPKKLKEIPPDDEGKKTSASILKRT